MKPAVLLFLSLSGCYAMTLDEFDSAAGWDDPLTEPARVDWSVKPKRYPWYHGVLSTEPQPSEEANPSGFGRERLADLIGMMGSDLSRIAQVARRLLWVAEKDPNPFNRITAVRGMEYVVQRLGVDPLDPAAYYVEPERGEGARFDAQLRSAHRAVEELLGRPGHPAVSAEQRSGYLAALRDYTARPLPRPSWRRSLIRTVWSVYVVESDPEVVAAAEIALQRAIYFAVCNGLRAALVPLQAEDFPAVRAEALRVYRRLGGIPAVSFVLGLMARPGIGIGQRRYDRDAKVRLALVRLCAQLRYQHAVRGNPRPIEFLYETAVDEDEDGDVRRVALEGLERCLFEQRRDPKISLDPAWAKEWWKEYITTRGRRP